MKAKVLPIVFLVIASYILFSFSDPYSVKRISDKDFRYEFYTTSKKIKLHKDKVYYWFKGGLIHSAQAGTAGELLEGDFIKSYHNNQLAEQGKFKKGLKVGIWKTWNQNGRLSSVQSWKSGVKSGSFTSFDDEGELVERGKYKDNKKTGTWINYAKKDTVNFKNGVVLPKEKKLSKEEKLKIKEEKKKTAELKKLQKKDAVKSKKSVKETLNATEKDTTKQNFIKRLFRKK